MKFDILEFHPMSYPVKHYDKQIIVRTTPSSDESIHYMGATYEEKLGPGRYEMVIDKTCLCCNKFMKRFYKIAWAYGKNIRS